MAGLDHINVLSNISYIASAGKNGAVEVLKPSRGVESFVYIPRIKGVPYLPIVRRYEGH